jgi:mRNA interferase RelE/StbE
MNKLDPSKEALKFLNSLDAKQYRQVVRKIFSLIVDPHPHDSEALKGYAGFFRADVGEYRILYRHEGEVLKLIVVGHRNDGEVYKEFEKKYKRSGMGIV